MGHDSKTGKRFLLGVSDECLVQTLGGYRLFCPQPLYRGQPTRTLGGKILYSWTTLNQDECHQQYIIRLWSVHCLEQTTTAQKQWQPQPHCCAKDKTKEGFRWSSVDNYCVASHSVLWLWCGCALSQLVQGKSIEDCVKAGHWSARFIIQVSGTQLPATCDYKA